MTEDRATVAHLPRGVMPAGGPLLAGGIAAHGFFRLAPRDVPATRKRPGPVPEGSNRVPPSLLRYSDEQTVAGLAAVFAAIDGAGLDTARFEGWGVIVASRYLGRATLAQALRSFDAEGVWGVSPHLIPHYALHSPSGTISLALGLHGPNLGVGGGLHSALEGFLAALTWLATGVAPGVWLVLTGWSPELVPDRRPDEPGGGECLALALALQAADRGTGGPSFRIVEGPVPDRASVPVDLERLAGDLRGLGGETPRTIATDPRGGLRVELLSEHVGAE